MSLLAKTPGNLACDMMTSREQATSPWLPIDIDKVTLYLLGQKNYLQGHLLANIVSGSASSQHYATHFKEP